MLADVLLLLSVAALGVFLGANVAEAALLVPFWREQDAPAFFEWYAANDKRLVGFFAPLTTACAVVVLAATIAAFVAGHPGRWAVLGAAVLVGAAAAMFPLYFRDANARFSAASVAVADLPRELATWAAWHNLRVVIVAASLLAALAAAGVN